MAKATKFKTLPMKDGKYDWNYFKELYNTDIDPSDARSSKVIKPYDMSVVASIPKDITKQVKYTVNLANFFRRYPGLPFTKVAFGRLNKTKVDGRKKVQAQPFLAFFDGGLFLRGAMQIRRNPNKEVVATVSRAHATQLFNFFGIEKPKERGQVIEAFFKVTPLRESEDKEAKKICEITHFKKVDREVLPRTKRGA